MSDTSSYTCKDYRLEMVLLGLKRKLDTENLSEEEKTPIIEEIRKLELIMGMD